MLVDRLGIAEIDQCRVAIGGDKNVAWFDVGMHHVGHGVEAVEAFGDLAGDPEGNGKGQREACAEVGGQGRTG